MSAPLATLEAVLERITYAKDETGYTVARVATRGSSDLLTVVGNLLGAQPGESLRLEDLWKSHPIDINLTRPGQDRGASGRCWACVLFSIINTAPCVPALARCW
jgi:hypothetical protein